MAKVRKIETSNAILVPAASVAAEPVAKTPAVSTPAAAGEALVTPSPAAPPATPPPYRPSQSVTCAPVQRAKMRSAGRADEGGTSADKGGGG